MMADATVPLITVVLVDDHELARQGVRSLLDTDPDIMVVGEADTSVEAIALIRRLQPDVVILDIRLRQGTGVDVTLAIKKLKLNTKVLILTAYDDPRYFRYLMRLGVQGYVTKDTSAEELAIAVHDVAACRPVLPKPGSLARHAPLVERGEFDVLRREQPESAVADGRRTAAQGTLTAREKEVLGCIARGLRNNEIADTMNIAPKTVEAHVEHVLAKLGAKSRTQAVVCALRSGWLREVLS